MSLTSRTSDTHNHLSRRISKKHSSLHTVTPSSRTNADGSAAPRTPSPFAPIQFSSTAENTASAYKPIFRF